MAHCGDVMAHLEMWWPLAAHQTSGAEVPGSNPVSTVYHNDPDALQDLCVIM